jgi:hypothetical protein
MDELLSVIICSLFGAVIWRQTQGGIERSGCRAGGFTATVLSGEYRKSWIYVILDLGEAAFGLALGFALARCVWPLLPDTPSNVSRTSFERSSGIG